MAGVNSLQNSGKWSAAPPLKQILLIAYPTAVSPCLLFTGFFFFQVIIIHLLRLPFSLGTGSGQSYFINRTL